MGYVIPFCRANFNTFSGGSSSSEMPTISSRSLYSFLSSQQFGNFLAAGRAPGRPKIHQHDFAGPVRPCLPVFQEGPGACSAGAISGFFTKRITGWIRVFGTRRRRRGRGSRKKCARGSEQAKPGNSQQHEPSCVHSEHGDWLHYDVGPGAKQVSTAHSPTNTNARCTQPEKPIRTVAIYRGPRTLSLRIDLRNGVDRSKRRAYVFRSRL